jgi:hypothetical protein
VTYRDASPLIAVVSDTSFDGNLWLLSGYKNHPNAAKSSNGAGGLLSDIPGRLGRPAC